MLNEQKISIVVPSLNQGVYLGETLESLVIQNYPDLEVIVQDAGSTDDSLQIAQNYAQLYPGIFKVFSQRDNGQAHGLNLGFKKATGTILGFLNSDDTLYPGCLARVANEINPQKGRFIVMGRCLFVGEDSPHGGLEHPSEFIDHFHHLAIWKRGANTIPQPSVFWHRTVWEKCGGFDESQQHVLDYELFCRFSRHFHFHKIDELWSTYRIHQSSKTFSRSEAEVMELAIQASRKNWGPWWSPLRWRCAVSYWLDNPREFKRARHHARLTEEAFMEKKFATGIVNAGVTLGLSPKLALTRFVQPPSLYEIFYHLERNLLSLTTSSNTSIPRYADGWIGPNFAEAMQIPADAKTLILRLNFIRPRPITTQIDFLIDGQSLKRLQRRHSECLEITLDVEQFRGKNVTLQILSTSSFVPRIHDIAEDDRELSMVILERSFVGR
jgi:glycosyltransferase involved in cell wall biosynthesis